MKLIKLNLKIVALFFASLILFQGCTVYKSTPVSINEAVKTETKVRITFKNGNKYHFSRVVLDNDGKFYGKKSANSNKTSNKMFIDENYIKKVQLKNRTATTLINIFSPIIILAILAASIADDIGPGWENR